MDLPVDKVAKFRVVFKDKCGNVTKVQGVPTITLSDPSLGTVALDAGGMSGTLIPNCGLGELRLTTTADTDLGAGVQPISVTGIVNLVAGAATLVTLEFDDPTNP